MRRQAILPVLLLWVSTGLITACESDAARAASASIDREVFIETYVDLRLAALASADFVVSPEERDAILARHGVDADALLRFADVHGRDVEFMNELWSEVERRIEEQLPSGV